MLSDREMWKVVKPGDFRLNAPFGARCFLTQEQRHAEEREDQAVLMHLLALGAF